jgi:outer membrane protein OmpA-like peptidoglycan-associated protein
MRILITGFIVLVIWSFFSMWLYVDVLKPAAVQKPVVIQPVSEKETREADSLKKFYASMPKDLMIVFDFDKSKFKPDQKTDSAVAEFKKWLEKYPEYKLQVAGNTDFIGTPDYNERLGLERAFVIQKYLESQGIGSDKITAISQGEDKPIADLITSAGRAKNRRTEVTLKK